MATRARTNLALQAKFSFSYLDHFLLLFLPRREEGVGVGGERPRGGGGRRGFFCWILWPLERFEAIELRNLIQTLLNVDQSDQFNQFDQFDQFNQFDQFDQFDQLSNSDQCKRVTSSTKSNNWQSLKFQPILTNLIGYTIFVKFGLI